MKSNRDYPVISGLICGVYVFLFYYSNNFSAINSTAHLVYFIAFFIVLPSIVFALSYYAFGLHKTLIKYRQHLLFVLIIIVTATLLSQAMYLTLKKKILLLVLISSILLSIKMFKHYKKVLVFIALMSILPLVKCLIHMYEHTTALSWTTLADDIGNAKFKTTPNIYIIQPDGYVSQEMMESKPYNYKSDLYSWMEGNEFKFYDNFRSNYPASLASNASMFAMKQHYFDNMLMPTFELPNARYVISGNNSVLSILKQNNYHTSFIVQDEYFQQNRNPLAYDFYNISHDEIPFFSNDNNVKKVVLEDLKIAMKQNTTQPRFYFVEKLLPHHVKFRNTIEEDRAYYIERVDSVNVWLKTTIDYIVQEDTNALVVVLADHGGWLGLRSYQDMFTTKDEININSIYSNIAAIRWNGFLYEDVDTQLKSNVNLFRVLFTSLSENKDYLKNLEDDSSYNMYKENQFYNSVYKVIDTNGNVTFDKIVD
nr:hypothetical protein [uncultured Psychroserpens sp.]